VKAGCSHTAAGGPGVRPPGASQGEHRQLEPSAGGRDRGMPACGGGAGRREM